MEIYHGSNVVIETPQIKATGFYKDFGFGFYCTQLEKQAQRWASTKKTNHVVNIYEYKEEPHLTKLNFDSMTEEWLDFIVACRRGTLNKYDIIEGPMADDTIWDYIEDFVAGNITREAFWVLTKFKCPTHQIVFCTEKALNTLTFKRSYAL